MELRKATEIDKEEAFKIAQDLRNGLMRRV